MVPGTGVIRVWPIVHPVRPAQVRLPEPPLEVAKWTTEASPAQNPVDVRDHPHFQGVQAVRRGVNQGIRQ